MQLSGSPRLVSDGQNEGRDQGDSLGGEDAQLGKESPLWGLLQWSALNFERSTRRKSLKEKVQKSPQIQPENYHSEYLSSAHLSTV